MHLISSKIKIGFLWWGEFLVSIVEGFINWRIATRARKTLKRSRRHWLYNLIVDDLLTTIIIVLIIQQFFFQLYVVPSGSMEKTILIGDRVLSDNFSFGPQILPGWGKLPGYKQPQRSDIIIFHNPDYPQKNPFWNILRKVVFFVTLSFVDLDSIHGHPAPEMLVKRMIGSSGDFLKFQKGHLYIQVAGSKSFIPESTLKKQWGLHYNTIFLFKPQDYQSFDQLALALALQKYLQYWKWPFNFSSSQLNQLSQIKMADQLYFQGQQGKYASFFEPSSKNIALWAKSTYGYYVPQGDLMPLGDNRDNSEDGRYFGVIRQKSILGHVIFRLWPLSRIGHL